MRLTQQAIVGMQARVSLRDAGTGREVRRGDWQHNLILDGGLNGLARDGNAGTCAHQIFVSCKVGSGTKPNSTSSGAITFTQTGATLTASAPFFTAGMIGSIFKWGSGSSGNERYIAAFTDNQNVTLDTSETVAVPEVGTVWDVGQTALQTFLYRSSTYDAAAGANSTSVIAPSVVHKRTFVFPLQALTYNVNEIGYSTNTTDDGTCHGRIVLSSTEVVPPTAFLVVELQFQITISPSAITVVSNVGTNIDTSGDICLESLGFMFLGITADGGAPVTPSRLIDTGDNKTTFVRRNSAYTQVQNGGLLDWSGNALNISSQPWSKTPGIRGAMRRQFSGAPSVTVPENLYGIGSAVGSSETQIGFDIKFTTPHVTAASPFSATGTWTFLWNRTLTN